MDVMEHEGITIELSPHDDSHVNFNQETTVNTTIKTNKTPMNPSRLEYSCWSTHWSVIPNYAFVVFTAIVIVVGVLTVYFSSLKPDQICHLNFKRSTQGTNADDSHPRQIAVGAFNKDKHLDLVVANSGTNCIGIFMGYGNGTFATQITYSTGLDSHPYSVAVGDFNNDTKLDIVVANYGINSIGVLLGDGTGNFGNPIITSLGPSRPIAIAVEDFNNDNLLDIAVVNDGTLIVAILVGTNNGSFRIDEIYPMGFDSIPTAIAVADINKDGMLDLVIVNYGTSELVIILRNGNQSSKIHKYSTGFGSHPISVDITDFHNDNILDIVVANSGTSNIGIFLGYGDGRFTNLTTYTTGSNSRPQSLLTSDFNKDSQPDIAVIDSNNNNVLVLKGNQNGSFSPLTTQSTGPNFYPYSITVGDFDNDGKPDLAIANNGTNNILIFTSFHIYPTFTQVDYTTEGDSGPWYVDVSDLNKDNYLDIIVPYNRGNYVGVFINLGNGSFLNEQIYDMGRYTGPGYVAIGDVNNDEHSDIVVLLHNVSQISILLGYGDGTFRHGKTYSMGFDSRPYTTNVGDFNNDDNLDIMLSHYYIGNICIFFGYGDGTFTNMTSLLTDRCIHPKCADVGDFNNDNILDIAASDRDGGNITILLGYGNGSFQNPIFVSTQDDRPNAFTVGDVNGDHQLDIVYSDTIFSHIGILLGNGNGSFGNLTKYSATHGSQPWFLSLGYYDDDALVDIAVGASYDSSINIFMGIGDGLFGTPIRILTGYNSVPWSVMFADFDNDNQQDLVVANDVTDNILVLFVRNDHARFENEIYYPTGSIPHSSSITVADFDNDGQLDDVLVANSGNDNIELLRDHNKGSFINTTFFSTDHGSHPQAVTIADFNRDHLLDIAVVNSWGDTMNVYLRLGDGSFDTKIVYLTGSASAPNSIAAGDFNRDGRMDIVIANQGADNIGVFLAHDHVMFTNDIIYINDILPRPCGIATGDLNNDGRLDIVVVNIDPSVLDIYLGYGNGTFSERMNRPIGSHTRPSSLAVGDFNNDNYLDIVVTKSNTSTIGVLLGYGNGSFQSQVTYSTGELSTSCSVAIGDFNNDGQLDIVVANPNSDNIGIFLGFGNGSFMEQIVYSMSNGSGSIWVVVGDLYKTWVAVDDLNNDTFLDIVVANYDASNVCILLGYGNGSFGNIITLFTGSQSGPCSIAIADLNRDHSLDIVVANQESKSIGIFFGYGNGTFSSQKIYFIDSDVDLYSVVVSDINNDTILDILITDCSKSNSSIGIFYGYGDGNFTSPKIYPTNSTTLSMSIATGDFDNDNRLDLAVTHYWQGSIGIMLQRKFDPFGSPELFPTGNYSRPKSVVVGDFNNDHQLDIAVANSGADNIGIRLGYGAGYFSDQLIYPTGSGSLPSSLATGDFNNDHYLDIAVVNSATDNMAILLGYGNGTFANMLIYSTDIHSNPYCIAVSDLNNDNHLDVVVANSGSDSVLVFLGNGDGTLFKLTSYSLGYNAHPQSVAIGDINNDHLMDIVVANDNADYIEILLQTCSASNII